MPISRHVCTGCQTSIYNVMVDGVRVPIVINLWAGQPDDTGPLIDLNAPGVKVPSFLREMMATPLATAELCVVCAAKAFGVPLVGADEDPMQGAGATPRLPTERGAMPEVERRAVMQERALAALQVGRGEMEPPRPGQLLRTQAEFVAYQPPEPSTARQLLAQARREALREGDTALADELAVQLAADGTEAQPDSARAAASRKPAGAITPV